MVFLDTVANKLNLNPNLMETLNKEITDTINSLIKINNDRLEGYDVASKETKEADLKVLFSDMRSTSRKIKDELVSLVNKYNGEVEQGTTNSGKLYRVWMDIKVALTEKDRKAILSSCEFGEDVALQTYDSVLKDKDLPSDIRSIVEKQRALLKGDHDRIKALRDSAFSLN
jgi:uncharacterized protein (TIGR02284 family)